MGDLFDMVGKISIVTGGSKGIGQAISRGLSEKGSNVIVFDIIEGQHATKTSQKDGEILFFKVDVSKRDDVEAAVNEVKKRYGRIDVLVNGAGIAIGSVAEDVTEDDWNKVIAVNLSGVFWCTQAAGRVMIEQNGGRIINITSRCAFIGYPNFISYNISKAGVISLTKSCAVEWARHNILVNAIAPGFVKTEMTKYVWSDPERLKTILDRTPLDRIADPEEIVGTVIFLASAASEFITGVVLPFDGGMLAY